MRAIWDEVLVFHINFFVVSPNHKVIDLFAFLIVESKLVAAENRFVLQENMAFADDRSACDAVSFELQDELSKFAIKLFEGDSLLVLFKRIHVFGANNIFLVFRHKEFQVDIFLN